MISEIERKALNEILHLQRDRDQIKLERDQFKLERDRLANDLQNSKLESNKNIVNETERQ